MRGFYGIGIESGKTPDNVGTLWRSAHALGAAFIFTLGARYPARFQATDTTRAARHIPLHEYDDAMHWQSALPRDCEIVAIECGKGDASPLAAFAHPERAVYVLGAEDRGLSAAVLNRADHLVILPGAYCLNVAVAGSIAMYDRLAKAARP